jgi:phosphoglycolate phosphatase-like HAD superfamily hydrolase
MPDALGAIRKLHAAGYTLRTASGEVSWELDGYLTGMRVRGCFVALYGPDQVDTAKAGPLFYERVFAHAAIPPGEVLVVDDSERALGWAAEVGARTVLCRPEPPANPTTSTSAGWPSCHICSSAGRVSRSSVLAD